MSHVTRYVYETLVSQCQSEVRLTPRSLPRQRVSDLKVETTPAAASASTHRDYFGNEVTSFTILEPHDQFTTTATSRVAVDAPPPLTSSLPWEAARDAVRSARDADLLEALEFVFSSPFVPDASVLHDYASSSLVPGRPLVEAVMDLSRRIHRDFRYAPRTTTIETPLVEVLKSRQGVCQDFAHVMIGALRSFHLPARYVSGYLRSGSDFQGAEASHAWVSVFVPGLGWFDMDPTNDVSPGEGHVTVAWGRDYGDVAPVKGIALGGGAQKVDVAVRVEPWPAKATSPLTAGD